MTRDESLTFIHNDDGPLDVRRVERILQLEAENADLQARLLEALAMVARLTFEKAAVQEIARRKDQQP